MNIFHLTILKKKKRRKEYLDSSSGEQRFCLHSGRELKKVYTGEEGERERMLIHWQSSLSAQLHRCFHSAQHLLGSKQHNQGPPESTGCVLHRPLCW